jgi:HEAT repeats
MRVQRGRGLVLLLCLLACGGIGLLVYGLSGKTKSTDELISDLKTGNEKERLNAVRTVSPGDGDAAKVIPALIDALRDGDSDVRRSAAIRLGYYGQRGFEQAKDAIPVLQQRQHDGDARVREAATKALERIETAEPTSTPASTTDQPAGYLWLAVVLGLAAVIVLAALAVLLTRSWKSKQREPLTTEP